MASLGASSLAGTVPFKEVVANDDHHVSLPDKYTDVISTKPSATMLGILLHNYRGSWLFHDSVRGALAVERRFVLRPDDVILASPPKCGTTWLKALSFAIMARVVYPPSSTEHPLLRLNPHDCVPFMDNLFTKVGYEAKLQALPPPRLMHTHMHHPLLPASITESPDCKIVYVCREPKDMLVSLWHFFKTTMPADSTFTFYDLFEGACEGITMDGPIWEHNLGYWGASKASPERVMFLRYEEMLRNPAGSVRELAGFLRVPFSAMEEAAGLPADIVKLCSIETLKGVRANKMGTIGIFKLPYESFFRKGVAGDWVNHMTPEMAHRFDAIVEDKLRGSGLSFKP